MPFSKHFDGCAFIRLLIASALRLWLRIRKEAELTRYPQTAVDGRKYFQLSPLGWPIIAFLWQLWGCESVGSGSPRCNLYAAIFVARIVSIAATFPIFRPVDEFTLHRSLHGESLVLGLPQLPTEGNCGPPVGCGGTWACAVPLPLRGSGTCGLGAAYPARRSGLGLDMTALPGLQRRAQVIAQETGANLGHPAIREEPTLGQKMAERGAPAPAKGGWLVSEPTIA